jgi:hypothetical protein
MWRDLSVGNWEIHNKSKQNTTHVFVLLARYTSEAGYALGKY